MWSQVKIEMGFSPRAVDILAAVRGKLLPGIFFIKFVLRFILVNEEK